MSSGISVKSKKIIQALEKVPTGIKGFDQISFGGLPKGRPTLICGNTGCGKTLMALEIIIRGALDYNEPGVFLTFEEHKEDLIKNVASLGFDLVELERKKLIYIDYIHIESNEYTEAGDYNLDGLFIRIENALKKISAKRIAIDTLEVLFSGFINEGLLRSEITRLFGWLKERSITTVLTGEQGNSQSLTRYGIEEYVADCVIFLSNNLRGELFTRRLQIIKYRGSYHETNQFPFLIGRKGLMLLPITSLEMKSTASERQISTGIPDLDLAINGNGYFEGSSILISGSSGTGKTTFAGAFAKSICKKKQKCLFFSYEESEGEILRNLGSVGMDFKQAIEKGYFKIVSTRPTQWGLEKHLGNFIEMVDEFKPNAIVIDPVSTLSHCGSESEVFSILSRMIDYLKGQKITFLMTMLFFKERGREFTYGISSIIDTWLLLRNDESNGEQNRDLLIIKSRGLKHSNQVAEFAITEDGIRLKEPYYGEAGVLTGTARLVQENKDSLDKSTKLYSLKRLHQEIELKKKQIEIQIQALNVELEFKKNEVREEELLFNSRESRNKVIKDELKTSRLSGKKKNRKEDHDKKRK